MHLEGVLIEDQQQDTLLYAGDMKLKITDWFFFKKEAEIKYVGLEDAVIKLQRTDSVWRSQFLLDYFGSSSSSAPKKKAGIKFDLKKLELKNVTFIKKDAWKGDDLTAKIGLLYLDANNVQLSGQRFDINTLYIKDPVVALRNYQGNRPELPASSISDNEPDTTTDSWNAGNMQFLVRELKIVNGTFRTDKDDSGAPLPYFDGKHLYVTNINGEFHPSSFVGDTILSQFSLSAKERSGFELKDMVADLKMTPQGMAFTNMVIHTNRSTIRNAYSMSYHNMDDLGDYIHRVKMTANFDSSYIDSDDIAFFAPGLGSWKKKIELKGKVRGTVDDIVGKDMVIQAGNSTVLNGDITMTGLPDINQTFIDFKANDFRTTYGDAVTIVPAMRQVVVPDLRKLQYVRFNGSFTGFIRDFVTFGTIQTNLGTLVSDLNMKLPAGQEPAYSGNISTTNFQLGEFLDDKVLGAIALKGTVRGRGFSASTRNTTLLGTIDFVDYKDYRYKNIQVNGSLNKKLFEGTASIRDENADLDMNGLIDFNGATPRFDLVANVAHADLRNLKLTQDSVQFKGKFNLNFTSSSIDNFMGTARITDAELLRNGHRLPFDSLTVISTETAAGKSFSLNSNEVDATFTGNFNLVDLPNGITYMLNKYYPAYIKAPRKYPRDQAFDFDITTRNVDEYLQVVDSSLSGFNYSHLSGNFNLAGSELNLTADIPQFAYKKYNFNNVTLTAQGRGGTLQLGGNAYNIRINDSLNIPLASFQVNAHNDSSRVSIKSGANRTVDTANLNALVLTYNDGVRIEVDPSSFTINGKLWTIDDNGELEFRSSHPASGSLVLKSGDQVITMRTEPSRTGGNWNDLRVNLTKVNIGDFSPLFLPHNRLEGLLSGNIFIEDPTGNLKASSQDLKTEFLRFDDDSLGEVTANLNYDNSTTELKVKGNTANQENYLGFDADVFLGDPLKGKNNIIALKARRFYLSVLERWLGDLFSDITGYLTGDVNITGDFSSISVAGKGKIEEAGLKVNFTQCFYKIRDTEIELTPEEINLDGIVLIDTVTKNPVYISGGIEHQSFKNMFYNLDISTRKPNTVGDAFNKPIQLINTTYKDNKQFFGSVKGTGSLSLLGEQSKMYMKVDAIASEKDSSYITIPPSSSRESGIADFLVERKFGREMTAQDLTKNASSIIYDVDVTANPMVNVRVVLDELTGDEIKGRGAGTLNIRSGTTEPLTLRGRFDIQEGNYLFTFQSFFKKPFELRKDAGNYIEWTGDPYNANIKFEAIYKAEKVSFATLGKSLNLNTNISNSRGDVYVVAKLTDKLFKPTIEFSLDFPSTSVAVTDPELALVLQQMQKNPNEINRQVTYLIVFNSFAPSELGGSGSEAALSFTTISGMLLNVVSDQIDKILSKLLKSDKYNINLNTSIYNRNLIDNSKTALNLGSNVNFTIGRSFFNNRFIISTGLFGLESTFEQTGSQQRLQFLQDVTLEWLINEKGTIRATFFYTRTDDYLSSATSTNSKSTRVGAGIGRKNEGNTIWEAIFGRRKKKPEAPPATSSTQEIKKEDSPVNN